MERGEIDYSARGQIRRLSPDHSMAPGEPLDFNKFCLIIPTASDIFFRGGSPWNLVLTLLTLTIHFTRTRMRANITQRTTLTIMWYQNA